VQPAQNMAKTASATTERRQTRSLTSLVVAAETQSEQDVLRQIDAASSREPLGPQTSTSQLSMAFIYYSVHLQKAALSKLEAKLTTLVDATPPSHEHFAAMQKEIDSLRLSKQGCDELLAEHKDSLQQYTNAKAADLRLELERVTLEASTRIATNAADLEAMVLVQKRLDEKIQAQQTAILELARGDETARRQEELIQAIHKLLAKCSHVLEARTVSVVNMTPKRHCQRLHKEVSTMQQQLLHTIEKLDPSIRYPESVLSPKGIGELLMFQLSLAFADEPSRS